jgi:hypothetical protein
MSNKSQNDRSDRTDSRNSNLLVVESLMMLIDAKDQKIRELEEIICKMEKVINGGREQTTGPIGNPIIGIGSNQNNQKDSGIP